MEKILEFEFDGGGSLRLELLAGGELSVRLQATHPGDGMRTTSVSVDIDPGKLEAIRRFLGEGGNNGLAR
jgi:hypothetical protein